MWTAVGLLGERERFGIVSTGEGWRKVLMEAVRGMAGGSEGVFGGVECCGVDAGGLHEGAAVEERIRAAVGRLVGGR